MGALGDDKEVLVPSQTSLDLGAIVANTVVGWFAAKAGEMPELNDRFDIVSGCSAKDERVKGLRLSRRVFHPGSVHLGHLGQ